MARAYNLVALSPNLVERVVLSAGEPRLDTRLMELARAEPEAAVPFSPEALARLVRHPGFERLPLVVVLPAEAVSIRRLEFPFTDPRQIRQAIAYELENELLEGLERYAVTHTIQTAEAGQAVVLAYLVERATLDAVVRVCQEHGLPLAKVTFAPHALYMADALHAALQFQVYLGAEQGFVSLVKANRLYTVKSFPFRPLQKLLAEAPEETRFTMDFMEILDRRRRRRPAASAAGEEAPGESASLANRRASDPIPERKLFLIRTRRDLNDILPDFNQFVRLYGFHDPGAITLHGEFAPFLAWDDQRQAFVLREDLPAEPPPARAFMSVLEELRDHGRELLSAGVVNFYRPHADWLQQIYELRRPLAAMAAGVLALAGLVGANVWLRVDAMQARARQLDRAIDGELRQALPGAAPGERSAQALRRRVQRLQEETAAASRFMEYHYEVMDLLKRLTELTAGYSGLTVESVTYTPERFSIAGKTATYNDSESLRNRLAELQRFRGSEPTITHQRTAQGITYRISIER